MRYRESMMEAIKQVAMYEQFDYVLLDKDNKIIARYKGRNAKKQAELNKKGAEKKVGVMKPIKVYPINPGDKRKIGDTVIAIGELTDKERGEIDESSLADVTKRLKAKKIGVKTISRTKDKVTHLYVHANDVDDAQKILKNDPLYVAGKLRVVAKEETLHEDRKNALAGFDNRIRDAASMDRKDFIKAKELYKRKDVKGLRKHIYSLDTSPLEVVMNLVSIQDRPFFDKMYPNTRGGEFLARIAYQHRHLDENIDENKDDEKKRMKGAKLRLKMGDALDEAVADLFVKKGDVNKIAVKIAKSAEGLGLKSGVMGNQVRVKGSQKNVNDFMRAVIGKSSLGGPSEVGASNPQIDKMLNKQLKKETIKEDGHTDVSSAVRQCKTITEDAMQIMGKLQSMSGEDSLPTWWTNKLAVASNSMNKIRDYLLVPSDGMNEQLQEAMGDLEDMKKVVKELENASKMHLAQSKRVAAHIGAMKKNEKTKITSKNLLDNKFKEEKNGAQHFSKVNEDNYVWNFVYDDFGRTKLTTEPDKATHLVYTMEGKDNPQLLKISEKEILDYKKGENYELSKKKEK
jgi:hypothetical protein